MTACFAAEVANANPTGPVVVNGQVSFAQAGSLLSVTNSPGSIINWQQFSIGTGEVTRFIQQSPSSAVLNRVVGMDPSSILGTLQSNGRVFLINPNGILFGAGARIDVGGLVASTLNLSNEDFFGGRLNFAGDPAKAAAVVNQGRITAAEGGRVYLIGSAVENTGVITAPSGEVVLAAGNSVRVTESPGSRLQVEITAPADSAVNLSEAVYGSRGIYGGLVRNSGTISADSAVRTPDGRIILKASNDVTLEARSRITANGTQGGSITAQAEAGTLLADGVIEATGSEGKGGTVELLGERVGLVNAAHVDASGSAGGGTVLLGGDYQGKNPDVQNAQRAYVGTATSIRADATHEGDGGKVVVWADGDTRYYGEISARGGLEGGNGGFVEVSGKQNLDFHGRVDVSAPQGEGGRVLLDPQDIVLNNTAQPSPPNNAIGTPDVAFADPPDPGIYTIQVGDVVGYAELFLQATNDITVSNALTMGAGNTIRFEADNNITINAALTTTGTPSTARPSITLTADADSSGAGTLAVNAGLNSDIGGITLSAASITGAGAINSTGGAAQNGGEVTIVASGTVSLTGAIMANGGTASGGIGRNGGTVSITGAGVTTGAITANGTAGAAGFAGGAGGAIQIDSTDGITTGTLTASGAAGGTGSVSGGTGGTINVTNNTAGNIATGNLTARAGAGTGTAPSAAGSITVTNDAA
ncbi:MAG TPA: filamentous hemagglutinin N-terminal domain-containing protein, partial [Burkholderiales bacterium]|nr:filamentous hemagglutinin N-terminal domain-containing protein [Burkholderiales bacterium]